MSFFAQGGQVAGWLLTGAKKYGTMAKLKLLIKFSEFYYVGNYQDWWQTV